MHHCAELISNGISQNVEYARTLLTQLERSLPQLKTLDRKHEAQAEIARDRQLLKRIQTILDEEDAKATAEQDDDDNLDEDDEWKELFSKPVSPEKTTPSVSQPRDQEPSRSRITDQDNVQPATSVTITSTTTQPEPTSTPPTSPSPPSSFAASPSFSPQPP